MDNQTVAGQIEGEIDPARQGWQVDGVPAWQFVLRALWVAILIYGVFCLGERGILFVYQGF